MADAFKCDQCGEYGRTPKVRVESSRLVAGRGHSKVQEDFCSWSCVSRRAMQEAAEEGLEKRRSERWQVSTAQLAEVFTP